MRRRYNSRATQESNDAITVAESQKQCTMFLYGARSIEDLTPEDLVKRYRIRLSWAQRALDEAKRRRL